jgi:tetratricopeptide (TPR) repeat protein
MLFDIRGRRKHVVRVVYAILALLMGASLFLVVGPFNVGNLINNGSSTSAASVLQEQVKRMEAKLRREPENEALLATLVRTHLATSNALNEKDPATGVTIISHEGHLELEAANEAWRRYLKQADSPSPSVAALMARGYFTLAETSGSLEESLEYVEKSAATQGLAAKVQPTVNSLTTLAIYQYFAGNFAAGDAATNKAKEIAPKEQRAEVKKQMAAYRQRGKEFEKQKKEFEKAEREHGKEALKNPFGELGGSTVGLGG